ncbi:MAG: hypothetical protein U9N87_08130, partial [Planctomycetota bacterium]|nr:hypothetical protein [Planctomycetota bacterium]
ARIIRVGWVKVAQIIGGARKSNNRPIILTRHDADLPGDRSPTTETVEMVGLASLDPPYNW